MAFVPDPGQIFKVIQFGWELCQSCHAAPVELGRAEGKVLALCLNLGFSQTSILEAKGPANKYKPLQSSLYKLLSLCNKALVDVKVVLQKYPDKEMSVFQKLKWSQFDKDEFNEALSYLEFLTTQLDKLLEKADNHLRAGQIEQELDKTNDADVAVNNTIKNRPNITPVHIQLSKDYSKLMAGERDKRPKKDYGSYLECWTVLKVTVQGTTKFQADKDTRGQWKLREMAEDTKKSKGSLALKNDDRVQWILKSSKDKEEDKARDWWFVAARLQRCNETVLGVEVEEQLMAIIKRSKKLKATKSTQEPVQNAGVTDKNQRPQCKLWPNCSLKDCDSLHPAIRPSCHYGLNCKTPGCRYTHPSIDISPCQNTKACTTPNCKFSHATPSLCRTFLTCSRAQCKFIHRTRSACRNGRICDTPACKYTHPAPTKRCWNEGKCGIIRCKYVHDSVQCRYGKGCTSPTCTFGHSEG